MTAPEKLLLIPKIPEGIVIDHIPAGFGLQILDIILRYPGMNEAVASVGLNYTSCKLGKKDMIKLQEIEDLPPQALAHIAVLCSGVSVKRVKDYKVEKKFVVAPPDLMVGQARCRNPGCITNHERDVVSRFRRVPGEGKRYKCAFCERIFSLGELEIIA